MIPHVIVSWERLYPSTLLLGERVAWAKGTRLMQEEIRDALQGKRAIPRWWAWLVREPLNLHDRNAIAVWIGSTRLGFVPAPLAADLAPKLDELRATAPELVPSCMCTVQSIVDRDDEAQRVSALGPPRTRNARPSPRPLRPQAPRASARRGGRRAARPGPRGEPTDGWSARRATAPHRARRRAPA